MTDSTGRPTLPKRISLFQPLVHVTEDGIISIDWSGSYTNSVTGDIETYGEPVNDKGYGPPECEVLDAIIGKTGEFSTVQQLRRLADYIEAHPAPKKASGWAQATNAELADALTGFADGQNDDLGQMLTETVKRLRASTDDSPRRQVRPVRFLSPDPTRPEGDTTMPDGADRRVWIDEEQVPGHVLAHTNREARHHDWRSGFADGYRAIFVDGVTHSWNDRMNGNENYGAGFNAGTDLAGVHRGEQSVIDLEEVL